MDSCGFHTLQQVNTDQSRIMETQTDCPDLVITMSVVHGLHLTDWFIINRGSTTLVLASQNNLSVDLAGLLWWKRSKLAGPLQLLIQHLVDNWTGIEFSMTDVSIISTWYAPGHAAMVIRVHSLSKEAITDRPSLPSWKYPDRTTMGSDYHGYQLYYQVDRHISGMSQVREIICQFGIPLVIHSHHSLGRGHLSLLHRPCSWYPSVWKSLWDGSPRSQVSRLKFLCFYFYFCCLDRQWWSSWSGLWHSVLFGNMHRWWITEPEGLLGSQPVACHLVLPLVWALLRRRRIHTDSGQSLCWALRRVCWTRSIRICSKTLPMTDVIVMPIWLPMMRRWWWTVMMSPHTIGDGICLEVLIAWNSSAR